MTEHFKSAISSIWQNKISSILTILGVVIGVASVTTLIALGDGLRKDITGIVSRLGTNVIAVVPGKLDTSGGEMTNPVAWLSSDILTFSDCGIVAANRHIDKSSPMSMVIASIRHHDKSAMPMVVGAYPEMLDVLTMLKLDRGTRFTSMDAGDVIILDRATAERLFGDSNPIGETVTLSHIGFRVIGVFNKPINSGVLGSEYNNLSLIPFNAAADLNGGQVKIIRILASARSAEEVNIAKAGISSAIIKAHGEDNITVMAQDDILSVFCKLLGLVTTTASAVAAISLIVGGIGIMNIMLITVTERTKEIGLRKAVGATRAAILSQFLFEALMITLLGGLIGLILAVVASAIIRANTSLHPAISPRIVLIAAGISITVGLLFGLWPALRASKKDPIEALRYE